MNYKLHYIRLIERALLRELPVGTYTERHHITPRCMGGTNIKNNLVKLTAEEHFVAHQLLVKIFPEHSGLVIALRYLVCRSDNQVRNNKEYAWIKNKLAVAVSKNMKGKKNALGYRHTPEALAKISLHSKGNQFGLGYKPTQKQRAAQSKRSREITRTPEWCEAIAKSKYGNKNVAGYLWINNGKVTKRMKGKIPKGWRKGRLLKTK